MSKTTQGIFDTVYHHIDAPTIKDENCEGWKLVIPSEEKLFLGYRTPELEYLSNKNWFAWRKIDGQNMRVQWDGEQVLWNGKSNKFTSTETQTKYMNNKFAEEPFELYFGREKTVVLFGEYVGPKIQTNELGLDHDEFILFDVMVNGVFLSKINVVDIASKFGLATPSAGILGDKLKDGYIVDTLDNLIKSVAIGDYKEWEGLVATPVVDLYDKRGNRIITKIKTRDYYRGE